MNNIYEMELHEVINVITEDRDWNVLRVPGGWHYSTTELPHHKAIKSFQFKHESFFVPDTTKEIKPPEE